MPIGKVNTPDVKTDLDDASANLETLNMELVIEKPKYDETQIIQAASELKGKQIDLLVLLPLHGACAPLLVLAAEHSEAKTVIWALPVRYSLPTSASAIGALNDKTTRAALVFGPATDKKVTEQIELRARTNFAINSLKETRIGTLGGIFSLMTASYYDKNVLRARLGPDVVHIPVSDYRKVLTEIDEDEISKACQEIPKYIKIRVDNKLLTEAMKHHLALRKLARTRNLQAMTLECHSELIKEFGINPCLGFVDTSYYVGCEGDVVMSAAALLTRYLTGRYVLMIDPFTIDSQGVMTMLHCGGPASCCEGLSETAVMKGQSPSHVGRATPLAMCRPKLKVGEKVTLLRLYGSNIDKAHVALGEIVSCETKTTLELRIRLAGGKDQFIRNICGNHYLVVLGDIRKDLTMFFASMSIDLVEN